MSFVRIYVRFRRSAGIIDFIVVLFIAALIYGLISVGKEWEGTLRPIVEIDLSPLKLPEYAFFSLSRGFAAYALSLCFTLVYGYIAAYNKRAERIMLPILDILQSIPVLGFLPTLVLGCISIFPGSNIGLELAAVIMMFTGQVWNMTFSFYSSLKAIPNDLREAGRVYKLNWWQRFTKLEMPYSTMGLVWNSMMSMAGGWFFLTINEAFVLGNKDFRLPGIGSYMSVAISRGNIPAMIYAIIAMTLMIVIVDQIFWRPIVAWSQKYKFEETGSAETASSFVLDILRRSRVLSFFRSRLWKPFYEKISSMMERIPEKSAQPKASHDGLQRLIGWAITAAALAGIGWGFLKMLHLVSRISVSEWMVIATNLSLTFLRVMGAISFGTMFMVPLGVVIGLHPKLSRIMQPVVQVVASFPAPMLFPLVLLALSALGLGIGLGAVVLMMMGTQWYILFNVVAGAMAIPHDLRETISVFRLNRVRVWRSLILPAIFPSLVTGWVTAAGGAWNASIVAEYVHFGDHILIARGLGATITTATDSGEFGLLAAAILAMILSVVLINRFFWRKLYTFAELRFSLNT